MTTETPLAMQAGIPYTRLFRFTGRASTWPDIDDCEARLQVRRTRAATSTLVADLTPRLTTVKDGSDITITLTLTGAQTRALAGSSGKGDLILSDTGTTDARAYRVPLAVSVDTTPTTAEDEA